MSKLSIYVAAPYARAEDVRRLHEEYRGLGYECTSLWAESAHGPESLTQEIAEEAMAVNDAGVEKADVLVMLVYPVGGAESFCEMTRALFLQKPVLYCPKGPAHERRFMLSSYRSGVVWCLSEDDVREKLSTYAAYKFAKSES
jgi:hypothetical protein